MVDIHSHIFHKIDDGAENIDITLEMLKNAVKDGIEKIVATLHYYIEYGTTTITEVKDYVNKLNYLIREKKLKIQIYSGSILGLFGRKVKLTAELFLSNGIYNFIGSDAHNNTNRTTGLSKAVNISNSINVKSEKIFMEDANKLLENKDIKFFGNKLNEKKSIFYFWNKTKKKSVLY